MKNEYVTSLTATVSNTTLAHNLAQSSLPASNSLRRIGSILTLITILCLCNFQLFAQSALSSSSSSSSGKSPSQLSSPCSSLTGSGTTNFLPLWTTGCNLGNSNVFQSASKVGIGTTSPVALLDVNGNINTATSFQIGTKSVLRIGSAADYNLFLGVGAGANNVVGSGQYNLFSGYGAGNANTSGKGNVFEGFGAGNINTTGYANVFVGYEAGYLNTTGWSNVFVGEYAGAYNTTGLDNIFVGEVAGWNNTTGTANVFVGYGAGLRNTTGSYDVFEGLYAGNYNSTGNYNVFEGYGAGSYNTTGSYNIYIGSSGNSAGQESNTIRIGDPTNQKTTFIAGVYGVNNGGVPVSINANGQLGTTGSSRRFKDSILDMNDSSSKLYQLRPVTFYYKPQYDDGTHSLQYGLIAEEVAEVYPEMVAYDKDGKPYTVKYQLLAPMLLNELQKEHTVVSEQQYVITTQQQQLQTVMGEMADLQKHLSRLESLTAKSK